MTETKFKTGQKITGRIYGAGHRNKKHAIELTVQNLFPARGDRPALPPTASDKDGEIYEILTTHTTHQTQDIHGNTVQAWCVALLW